MGFDIGGLLRYHQHKQIDWTLFWPLTITSVVGALIGGNIILNINEDLITKIIGAFILICIPFALWKKHLGVSPTTVSNKRRWIGHFMSLLTYTYGGSFNIGFGIFHSLKQMYFYGLTVIQSEASGKLPTIIGSLTVVALFWINGAIVWGYAASLMAGMFIGSYIGVKYAILFGNKNLKYVLLLSMVGFSVRFLLF